MGSGRKAEASGGIACRAGDEGPVYATGDPAYCCLPFCSAPVCGLGHPTWRAAPWRVPGVVRVQCVQDGAPRSCAAHPAFTPPRAPGTACSMSRHGLSRAHSSYSSTRRVSSILAALFCTRIDELAAEACYPWRQQHARTPCCGQPQASSHWAALLMPTAIDVIRG